MKKIGIIGSGTVGQHLADGFIKSGYEVKIGTRNAEKLAGWRMEAGDKASVGNVKAAAAFGDIIVLATKWDNDATKNAIEAAGKENFSGKIVMDITNPIVFDKPGQPPKLGVAYPESAGLLIQQWLPQAKVVKVFNIITAAYMANPQVLKEGKPLMFVTGDHDDANETVMDIARAWGWEISSLGGIEQSYLMEALAMVWIRYGFINGYWTHALSLIKA